MATVSFAQLVEIAPHILNSRHPLMIRGRHGIGKSEVVYQIAKNLEMPIIERRASQMTEGDLIGMPDNTKDDNVTSWKPPDWFYRACKEAVVVFLDEIDRAVLEVRQGIFELADSRKINGWVLHPDTLIVAAVNGGIHAAHYQVNEMEPAELDRWTVFDVEPTVEDFLEFSKGKLEEVILDFIRQDNRHLEHFKDFEPGKVYPSRRSWFRLNKTIVTSGVLQKEKSTSVLASMFHLANGYVGLEAASALRDFYQNYDSQVSVEDILVHGKLDLLKKWKIQQFADFSDKLVEHPLLNVENIDDNVKKNIREYYLVCPAEIFSKLITSAQKNINLLIAVYSHPPVKQRMVDILTTNQELVTKQVEGE